MAQGDEPSQPAEGADSWDAIEFNDDFVQGARRSEASADERVSRAQRVNAGHEALEKQGAISPYATLNRKRFGWLRRNKSWLIPVSVLLALALALFMAPTIGRWLGAEIRPPGWPPTAQGEHASRVKPAANANESLSYSFQHTQANSSKPVTYDPCRVIHYVINTSNAPAGADAIVQHAFKSLTKATGLQYVYEGTTRERFMRTRPSYQPARYGDRWAPVLIVWSNPEQDPLLKGDVIGDAGSSWVSIGDGARYYVTGTVSLDAPQLGGLMSIKNGPRIVRSIVLHEIGHLAGLSHVSDSNQLMFPHAQDNVLEYQAGDLAGLALLGQGQCSRAF